MLKQKNVWHGDVPWLSRPQQIKFCFFKNSTWWPIGKSKKYDTSKNCAPISAV